MENPPPQGVILNVEETRSLLSFIFVLTPLGTILVPLIIVLFVFSPPHSRRHPVFILNVLACCLGIAEAVIGIVLDSTQILYPLRPISKGLLTTVIALAVSSPLLIDSILVFRILAFYPFNMTPVTTLVAILAFPLLIKCGRFIAVIMYLDSFRKGSTGSQDIFMAVLSSWPKNPFIIAEWTMQMVDNAYASSIFLYKIWEFRRSKNSAAAIRSRSLLSFLRSLFVIALGNFIFPIIMNIALIVLIAKDPSFTNGALVLLSNNYVSILGVVFATIWTRKRSWNQEEEEPFKGEHFQDRRIHIENRFAFDPISNTRSLLSIPVFGSGPGIGVQETATASSDLLVFPGWAKAGIIEWA